MYIEADDIQTNGLTNRWTYRQVTYKQMNLQTDGHNRWIYRQIDLHTDRYMCRMTHTNRWAFKRGGYTDRWTYRQMDIQTDGHTDRWTCRQKDIKPDEYIDKWLNSHIDIHTDGYVNR